ncbi:hypothetical protein B0E55_05455 [Rhodococcus sp. 66b]|nr:hypothetical protein B0E55_05455 [Rhodococcus sp. 66b]
MCRQSTGDEGAHFFRIQMTTDHVRVQPDGVVCCRHRSSYTGVRTEHRVDLTEFDAETANLDLRVTAAEILEFRSTTSHEVSGAVHPQPRT